MGDDCVLTVSNRHCMVLAVNCLIKVRKALNSHLVIYQNNLKIVFRHGDGAWLFGSRFKCPRIAH